MNLKFVSELKQACVYESYGEQIEIRIFKPINSNLVTNGY